MANPRICSVDGCDKPHEAHDFCAMHYTRWRKGDINKGRKRTNYGPICSVNGCAKPSRTRGWCDMHYMRWLTHGDVHCAGKPKQKTKLQKFIDFVVVYKGDDCIYWPWRTKSRRGSIYVKDRLITSAKYICTLAHGDPPTPKHEAAHSCGHGWEACLNPNHLRWATRSENQMDRIIHGTSNRGERNGVAVLTEADVKEIKRRLSLGEIQRSIAESFGVSRSAILSINLKQSWGWLA